MLNNILPPYDQALKDYTEGDKNAVINVHSNLTENEEIPVAYLFRSLEEMPEMEQEALSLCKGKILDVGAGVGCHSQVLKEKGLGVKAIDISQTGVAIMSEKGIDAQQVNLFDFEGEKFDTILLLMNGVGIAGDLEGLQKLLAHAKELLNPGGQILIDSTDIIYMFMEEDGSVLLDLNDKYYGEMTYEMEYKGQTGKSFPWLYIDFENLEEYANDLGFTSENIFHDDYSYLARLTLKA